MKQAGFSEAALQSKAAWQERLFELLRAEKPDPAAIDDHIRLDAKNLGQPAPADPVVEANRRALLSANFASFLDYDPGPTLEQVICPVLVLQGMRDLQVLPEQNLPVIEAALAKSKNPASSVERLEGLNHAFQHAETGAVSEYATISETLASELLEAVHRFIAAR